MEEKPKEVRNVIIISKPNLSIEIATDENLDKALEILETLIKKYGS